MFTIKYICLAAGLTFLSLVSANAANNSRSAIIDKVPLPAAPSDNATAQSAFQAIAKVEPSNIKPDTPVVLQLAFKNTTDRRLKMNVMAFGIGIKLNLKNERNEQIHLTRYGEMLQNQEHISRTSIEVASGQEAKYRVTLNRLYDLTMSGTYEVTATAYAPKLNGLGEAELKSNPVRFTIVRGDSYYLIADSPTIFYPPGTQPPPPNLTPELSTNPVSTWKINDSWRLSVDFYSMAAQPKPAVAPTATNPEDTKAASPPVQIATYGVKVKIWGEDELDGVKCWVVRFIPDAEALTIVQSEEYSLWIGKQDGLIHHIVGLRGRFNPSLSNLAGIPFVTGAVFGYPLEMLPLVKQPLNFKSPDGYTQFSLQSTPADAGAVLEAQLKLGGKDRFVIRQMWATGAKWWSEYEKQDYNQHLILKAKLLAE